MVDVTELEDQLQRVLTACPRDAAVAAEVLERAISACRADPEARDWFDLPGLLDELAEIYQQLGRVDDALEAMRAAIDAGYAGSPDPRCRLAEIMLRAGRTEPAAQIYAQVKADTPDDVWLYNSAGLEYAAAGDPQQALDWLTQGLRLALDTDDPENLIAQLRAPRREQLNDLGHNLDELDARAETFLTQSRTCRQDWSWAGLPAALGTLDTGENPALAPAAAMPPADRLPTGAQTRIALAVSWFPADQFDQAMRTWPDLSQDWDITNYTDYTHRLERHLHKMTTTGPVTLWIAPIQIEAFQRWCHHTGRDPATNSARAGYAAERARIAAPELIAWPPARNAPCWCGTGHKYKKCCGHPNVTRAAN
jgi:tetratricopeptide (TPR) repeat protein